MFRAADGNFLPLDLIRVIQDRQKGSVSGFTELERLLEFRQTELKDLIIEQEKQRQEQQTQQSAS